jgi:DNA-binding protein YbaB
MSREYPSLDRLEALVQGLDTMSRDLGDRLGALAGQSAEGISDSGLVLVVASVDGAITDVRIDPRAKRAGSQDLAAEFLQAATRAQERAAELSKEAVRALLDPIPGAADRRDPADRHDSRWYPDEP